MDARQQSLKSFNLHMRSDLHLMRKSWHVGTGLLGLWAHEALDLSAHQTATILLGVALVGLLIDFVRLRSPFLNRIVLRSMKSFMRESEKLNYSGLPFYALGVSLSLFFFDEGLAILAILFLIFSDPISSIFGILYGRNEILPHKSLQGSLAGFLACYTLCVAYSLEYLGHPNLFDVLVFSILGGIIGMSSELVSSVLKVDDNLTIPLISSLGLTFVNAFVPLF